MAWKFVRKDPSHEKAYQQPIIAPQKFVTCKTEAAKNLLEVQQRRTQNPVTYITWSVFRKQLTPKSRYCFSQNILS